MATRTITAMFDTRAEAERAVQALASEAGVDRNAVHIGAGAQEKEHEGFLSSLKSLFVPDEDRYAYSEGMRRGGAVVTAQVEESRLDRAMDVLEQHGAVDLDEREAEWRKSGWTGYAGTTAATGAAVAGTAGVVGASSDGTASGVAAMPGAATTATTAATARPAATGAVRGGEEAIPIVEERLTVGKREVNRGRVRVRSYVVETPVQEQVALREEHVDIERRAVNRPLTGADATAFQERTIEATESAEEAVVAKEARVVEEVVVRKEAEERVQTVQDKVRRTEVEVDDERRAAGTTATGTTGTTTGTTRGPNPGRT